MNALITRPAASLSTSLTPLTALQAQVYREARDTRPLPRLMTWVLERRNLEAAWDRVRGADGADTPGPDGVVADEILRQGPAWLTRLADDLLHRRYRPTPPRWIDIPKEGKPGQVRRLGLLTLRDRVVLASLKQILEPVLDSVFLPSSFGFRPGRSVPGALAEAVQRLTPRPGQAPPFSHAVHLDVADCFDTIDHRLLLAELMRQVSDVGLLALIEAFLETGAPGTGRFFWRRNRGLVQGSGLSPLLCNLALHPLDVALQDLAAGSDNGLCALRYADDLLLLARDARLADAAIRCTRQVLGAMQQRLREPVTRPAPVQQGVEWLGVCLKARTQPWATRITFGYHVPDRKVVSMLARLTEMTAPPSERIDAGAFNLGRWIASINEQLRDWRQAYLYADNALEVFRALDDHCRERVGELLQSVTGLRWQEVSARHRARLPRGFWTWEVPGVRLVVLSSQAPHAPGRLTRRPAWMQPAAPASRAAGSPVLPGAGEAGGADREK